MKHEMTLDDAVELTKHERCVDPRHYDDCCLTCCEACRRECDPLIFELVLPHS